MSSILFFFQRGETARFFLRGGEGGSNVTPCPLSTPLLLLLLLLPLFIDIASARHMTVGLVIKGGDTEGYNQPKIAA